MSILIKNLICHAGVFYIVFLTLSRHGMYKLFMTGINEYMEDNLTSTTHESIYELYCYSGGLINVFINWNENGRKETTGELARILYNFYHSV